MKFRCNGDYEYTYHLTGVNKQACDICRNMSSAKICVDT